MTSRVLTAALAALTIFGAMAPAAGALAQHDHGGPGGGGNHGGPGGGDNHGGGGGGFRGGDRGDHGGGAGGALAGFGIGMALGAALGNYGGHPYYCRDHHHWRWSHRRNRYVYDYRHSC